MCIVRDELLEDLTLGVRIPTLNAARSRIVCGMGLSSVVVGQPHADVEAFTRLKLCLHPQLLQLLRLGEGRDL